MARAPSTALLLEAWEVASFQTNARRPLTVLSLLLGRRREALETMTIGEVDALTLRLRADLFGQRIVAVTACPSCGTDAELSFRVKDVMLEPEVVQEVTVPHGKHVLKVRPLHARDLEAGAAAPDVREALFKRSLIEPIEVEVTEELFSVVGKALVQADPQSNIELTLNCPTCDTCTSRHFDPWAFFWNELESWALRTISQVDLLARAYGWTETEILSLSPPRRTHYLRLLGA